MFKSEFWPITQICVRSRFHWLHVTSNFVIRWEFYNFHLRHIVLEICNSKKFFKVSGWTLIKPSQQSQPVRQPRQLRLDPRPHDQRFDWKPFRFSPSKFLRCVRHAVNGWNGGTESCGFGFLTLCAHSGHDVYPTLGAVRAAHCRYLSRLFIEKTRQTGN